ncbi:hypothetical protein ACFY2W_15780 [Streptomyces sp. NPDC001262]|uniref:hypothetical protein n=1 Tax=Streptomyces sp. NPDC001262 TaxID=3364552 RepID=UPI0036AE7B20
MSLLLSAVPYAVAFAAAVLLAGVYVPRMKGFFTGVLRGTGGPGMRVGAGCAALVLALCWIWTARLPYPDETAPLVPAVAAVQLAASVYGLGTVLLSCLRTRGAAAARGALAALPVAVVCAVGLAVSEAGSSWALWHTGYGAASVVRVSALAAAGVSGAVLWRRAREGRRRALTAAVLLSVVAAACASGYLAAAPETPRELRSAPVTRALDYDPAAGSLCGLHGKGVLSVTFDRADSGGSAVRAVATDRSGTVRDLQAVGLTFTHIPDGRTVTAELRATEGGIWATEDVALGRPGQWRVTGAVGMSWVRIPAGPATVAVF